MRRVAGLIVALAPGLAAAGPVSAKLDITGRDLFGVAEAAYEAQRQAGPWVVTDTISGSVSVPITDGQRFVRFITDEGTPEALSFGLGFDSRRLEAGGSRARMWSLDADVGTRQFHYRDPVTLAQRSDRRTPYSAALKIGGVVAKGPLQQWAAVAGVKYAHSAEAAPTSTVCGPGGLNCVTGRFGPPRRDNTTAVFAAAWREWGLNDHLGVGLRLKPAYDFADHVAGVETIAYLAPTFARGYRLGVKLKLQERDNDPLTDDERFKVGGYIGKAF